MRGAFPASLRCPAELHKQNSLATAVSGKTASTEESTETGAPCLRNFHLPKQIEMEPTVRIELTTRALRKRCSTD